MTAIEFIKLNLKLGQERIHNLLQGIEGHELTTPISGGGNHALWIVGHLAWAEGSLIGKFVRGESNPLESWTPLFGIGSKPEPDAGKYPALCELISHWNRLCAATMDLLSSLQDADLDRPSKAPPERAAIFGTIGHCLAMIGNHQSFHAGQIADARRAAGLKPVFG